MNILNLTTVGQIYLVLAQNWEEGKIRITVKNGDERPFDDVLVNSKIIMDSIYKYLLENWAAKKLQIFLKELP